MKNKSTKIMLSTALATSAFITFSPKQQADAASTIDKLVSDAQKAGNVLKWAISIEGSADGVTQPWNQFNGAKSAIAKAESALKNASYSDKLKYDVQLMEPKTHLLRAQAYLDAITASQKIEAKTKTLSDAVDINDVEEVEAAYHQMTAEYRKQTILLDRVYGQSTRDSIRNVVKGPAEELIKSLKNDVTVHMHSKAANADLKAGKIQEATKKIDEAKAILGANTLLWESTLQSNLDEVIKTQPLQIATITREDNTTVTVKLNKAVTSVQVSEFTFDNSLSVTGASLSQDGTTVILKTSVQLPGTKYVLKYKDSAANFTVPGSLVPILVGDMTTQHRDTTEVVALTANFTGGYSDPTKSTVKIDIPVGVKVVNINGIENNIVGGKTINVTPDKAGNITLAFTAKDINTPSVEQVFKFTQIENNNMIATKTSAAFNFYSPAKAGTFTNKKVKFIDTINNYFVTADGVKYNVKTTGDIYKNEDISVSLDSFKSALNNGDTVGGSYQLTDSSTFNIVENFSHVDLVLDSKFTYKTSTAGYRIDQSQIEFVGTGQPKYELLVYKNTGAYLGKTVINSDGTWKYTASVDQNEITDYSFVQQEAGFAVPVAVPSGAKTLRVVEGPFSLSFVSAGSSPDKELANEAITFTVAPVQNFNGLVLAQDNVVLASNASIIVQDLDGTTVKYTNNQDQTIFSPVSNGFKINFGTINPDRGATVLMATGTDSKLLTDLRVMSITGVTNQYGLDLNLSSSFQIKNY